MKPAPEAPAPDKPPGRRQFLQQSAAAMGGACAMALGLGLYTRQAGSLPATALRPPGALSEEAFLAACVRCGLCVRACPSDPISEERLVGKECFRTCSSLWCPTHSKTKN